jgi:hypothetical protein
MGGTAQVCSWRMAGFLMYTDTVQVLDTLLVLPGHDTGWTRLTYRLFSRQILLDEHAHVLQTVDL